MSKPSTSYMDHENEIVGFLNGYPVQVNDVVCVLRKFIKDALPDVTEQLDTKRQDARLLLRPEIWRYDMRHHSVAKRRQIEF